MYIDYIYMYLFVSQKKDGQMDRQIDRPQADGLIEKQISRYIERKIDGQVYRQIDRKKESKKDRQVRKEKGNVP